MVFFQTGRRDLLLGRGISCYSRREHGRAEVIQNKKVSTLVLAKKYQFGQQYLHLAAPLCITSESCHELRNSTSTPVQPCNLLTSRCFRPIWYRVISMSLTRFAEITVPPFGCLPVIADSCAKHSNGSHLCPYNLHRHLWLALFKIDCLSEIPPSVAKTEGMFLECRERDRPTCSGSRLLWKSPVWTVMIPAGPNTMWLKCITPRYKLIN